MHARRPSKAEDDDSSIYQSIRGDKRAAKGLPSHNGRSQWPPSHKGPAVTNGGRDGLTAIPSQALNTLPRFVRTPRGLATLVLVAALVVLTASTSGKPHHALARQKVPKVILPAIKQSGKLIHHISPAIGSRVKSWSEKQEKAHLPQPVLSPEQIEQRSAHTFHPNGLLLVNDKGKHPIMSLIERAEKTWRAKITQQSKTLPDAVREYKRRYRRNPPKGFDDWWAFCERHNVQLRDEYDQINRDLLPHWALEPSDSRQRNKAMQDRPHTFLVSMTPGERKAKPHGEWSHIRRATDMADLMSMFAGNVPKQVNMTFIMDDNPAVMLPWSERDRMVELAEEGEYLGPSEFFEPEDPDLSNFARACPPNSPIRRAERGERYTDYSGQAMRSFIWDHAKATDLCNHPEIRKYHGHTMAQGVDLAGLVPLCTWAKTKLHSDILVTPLEQYSDSYLGYEPPWDEKSENRLLWRGSTTGVEFDKHTPWRNSQRARLHLLSQNTEGDRTIMWAQRGVLRESNFTVAALNHLYLDTAFSGEPAQCDEETCEIMRKTLHFKPVIGLEDSNQYKYLIDVDGNGWSGRFHRLMSTRSVVLKSTVFPEWYQDRVQPWVHYVPVKVDYSDLYDIMAFFIGTPDGQGSHDSLGERIGEAGKQWAAKYWRRADMAAYMYRLVLEYSRILHHDTDDVDYIPRETELWT